MNFSALADVLSARPDAAPLSMLPYAATLGLNLKRDARGIVVHMPFAKRLIGAPKRLHGGTVAGMLEIASIAELIEALGDDAGTMRLKPINVTVDFLRGGACTDSYAHATITRLGRRIANIRAEAWQGDPEKPIAGAHMNVLLERG